MKFRPCIDIHDGSVKQIVGGSLKDEGEGTKENYVSSQDASFFAELYKSRGLKGGHVILLNRLDSDMYKDTLEQAYSALKAYPGGLQVGGGINPDNAESFLEAGASHVIVTSFVFKEGKIDEEALRKMLEAVGREKLVLDLSCRKKGDDYYIVTDRWQKFTDVKVEKETLNRLAVYCDEFLVHAADIEGLRAGVDEVLIGILSQSPIPVTYAGGVHNEDDLEIIRRCGKGKVDFTVGSALDIFGGNLKFEDLANENID